jgi:DNA-binding response OmpR family regulator
VTESRPKPKILVIEDHPDVLAAILYLLKHVDCEGVGARTGAEGMQLARDGQFDLITLDIDLPDTNGLELCQRLKQDLHLRHIPVIFVSGLGGRNRQRCLELGAADYIAKPFDIHVFVSRIFAHLKTAQ